MVNTRSRSKKTKPSASNKGKPAASNKGKRAASDKAKPEPKPKAIRFAADTKTSKRETKNAGHQSRDTHRDTQRGRSSRRSPSPRRSFDRRDFDFSYGVQSPGLGHGPPFEWRYPVSPFGFFNYPNYPAGFGPHQHHLGNVSSYSHSAKGKRHREPSSDSESSSINTDQSTDSDVELPAFVPSKRIARSKSCKSCY